ncbi:MAG: peptidase [Bacteroidetes bacterium]|nr:peptidase [Bacteroidota bacterium]
MKIKLKKIKKIWSAIRRNWRVNHRLVITDESTHAHIFELLLTPRRLFVVITTSAFVLIFLTTMLIAFTPLRLYVPGYTNPDEYRKYKKMAVRVDSLENALQQNQQYLDNFYNVLNGIVKVEETEEIPEKTPLNQTEDESIVKDALTEIDKKAEQILFKIVDKDSRSTMPLPQKASVNTITLSPPAVGVIYHLFSLSEKHYGIDIKNEKGTLITSVSKGVILYSGYTPKDGNMIMVQHSGDVISIYKSIETILKKTGDKVNAGDPIATMGNSGMETKTYHLHFELWYNGVPVNPIEYMSIN